jgi:hypothetical protein
MTERKNQDESFIGGGSGQPAESGVSVNRDLLTQGRDATSVEGGDAEDEASVGSERRDRTLDPGDPGGMGGVRAQGRNVDNRPPGGVSPIDGDE